MVPSRWRLFQRKPYLFKYYSYYSSSLDAKQQTVLQSDSSPNEIVWLIVTQNIYKGDPKVLSS